MDPTEDLCNSLGICLYCAGHSQEACFCSTLFFETSVSTELISISTPLNLQFPSKKTSRQLKKDNDSHKRFSTILKSIYRMLIGEKIEKKYRKFYYRQDFMFLILSLLEKNGNIIDAYRKFKEKIIVFKSEIQKELADSPIYLEELEKLITRYERAFPVWMDGNHKESMIIVYDYNHMRQKKKFQKAVRYIQQIRTECGLPFIE